MSKERMRDASSVIPFWKALLVFTIVFLLPLLAGLVTYELTGEDYSVDVGVEGLRASGSKEGKAAQAIDAAESWADDRNTDPPGGDDDGGEGDDDDGESSPAKRHRIQSRAAGYLSIVMETDPPGGNVLVESVLQALRAAERTVQHASRFSDFCKRETTDKASGKGCQRSPPVDAPECNATRCQDPISPFALTQLSGINHLPFGNRDISLDLPALLGLLERDRGALKEHLNTAHRTKPLGYFFDREFVTGEKPYPSLIRSVFVFGFPLEGYERSDERKGEQKRQLKSWFRGLEDLLESTNKPGTARVFYTASGLTEMQMLNLLLRDLKLVAGAAILLTFGLYVTTGSLVVALTGVATSALSFPAAFSVYSLMGIRYLSWFHGILPFILLGIGVDDVMVMHSAMWRNDFFSAPTYHAYISSVKQAAKTITTTSITTATVFMSLYFRSLLPPVRYMGLFAAFVVIFDLILVLTLLPCAVVLQWHVNYFLSRRSFSLADDSERMPLKMDMSLTSEDISMDHEERPTTRAGHLLTPMVDAALHARRTAARLLESAHAFSKRTKSWLREAHIDLVYKHYAVISAVSICALAGSVVLVITSLQIANSPPQMLKSHTWLHQLRKVFWNRIYSESHTRVDVLFGVKEETRRNGQPQWDSSFDLAANGSQVAVLNLCDAIVNSTEALMLTTPHDRSAKCFMADFSSWLQREKGEALPLAPSTFRSRFAEFQRNNHMPGAVNWRNGTVQFAKQTFFVRLTPRAAELSDIERAYDGWEKLIAKHNSRLEAQHAKAIHGSDLWIRIGFKRSIRQTATLSPAVTATVAILSLLVCTWSIKLTLLSAFALLHAVLWVIAVLVAAGWTFGVLETICLTLMLGSAVDYCIHVAASTRFFGSLSRGLREATPAILVASVTTAVSAAFLIPCKFLIFSNIGIVLVLSSFCGLFAATLSLPSIYLSVERLKALLFSSA